MTFMKPDFSQTALPLRSLRAVVLDTETTGLDATSDRIVQIGAVRLAGGKIDLTDPFDKLVNPGISIPQSASDIHGIKNADVDGACSFATVMSQLAAWAGSSVVLGYSIGFDLAMLRAEHERKGLTWRPPRSLDVAHLVQLLSPNLPSTALDPTAAWLGIDVQDRHQALGDAILTAKVYRALLLKLQTKGIRTLAEAERACRALTPRIEEEARAGWHDVMSPGPPRSDLDDLTRIDSFPYRHRLREIMQSPPVMAANNMQLGNALRLMMQNEVSSVFLPPMHEGGDPGILTERDLLRAIDREKAGALEATIDSYATRPLITLDQDAFVYRAINRMAHGGFRHLGVSAGTGVLVGALSARDLLKQRDLGMIMLGESIETATTTAMLGEVWAGLAAVVGTLVREDVDACDIAAIISLELQALTKRACEIAELAMIEAGQGEPPEPYAMLVLGSGGRGESLLAMDQDNAIIYREGEPGGPADQWFETLGQQVATILDEVGIARCKGGVMASNAAWRMDVNHWRRTVERWIRSGRSEHVLKAHIFFDGLPVHGELELGECIRIDAIETVRHARSFLQALSVKAAEFEAALSWFGRFRVEDGRADLKKGGLMALSSTARVLALRFGILDRSTRRRFEAVQEHLEQGPETVGDLIEAHRIIMDTILRQQLRDLEAGIQLSSRIQPSKLTSLQRQALKWSLRCIDTTANLLGTPTML